MVCSGDTFKSAGACQPISACERGSYVVQGATAVSDRICGICPSGTFSTAPNSAACTPWQTCQPGSYVTNAPSPLTDRLCSPCAAGTYTSGVNESVCLGPSECPAGTIEMAPGTSATAPTCGSCSPGEHCAGGKALPMSCGGDTWDDDGDPATPCVAKTVCAAGTWVTRPGSALTDRICTLCSGGTFSVTENAASCAPWRNCPAGTYVANMPSPSSDRWCVACPADTFTTGENQSTCSAFEACPAGTIETVPRTATTGPECTPCSPGQYCAGGSIPAHPCAGAQAWDHDRDPTTLCVPWSVCLPGYYVSIAGTATQNRVCDPCSAGSFTDSDNQSTCQPWTACPANTSFISMPGTASSDLSCSPCREAGCSAYCTLDGECRECADHRDCAGGLSCVNGTCTDLGCGADDWYFQETFLSGPIAQFWTLEDEWEVGPATGTGEPGADPAYDHTGPGTDNMLAGVVIGGNVSATIMSQPAYLTSAPVDTSMGPSPVYLEFYRWLNSGTTPAMTNTVEVWDGSKWIAIWSGPTDAPLQEDEWSQQVFDVTAYRNPYFRVRFGYIVEGAGADAWSSWNIDDVRIASTPSCPTPIM